MIFTDHESDSVYHLDILLDDLLVVDTNWVYRQQYHFKKGWIWVIEVLKR